MKKVILGLSALCMVAFTSCKEENAASKINSENVAAAAERDATSSEFPVISFEETEHDFGTIINGTPVETNIKSTCGCTVPSDWKKDPIAPGESAEFTVKFNGKGNNQISKSITLTTNTEKGSEVVKIKAFIEPDPNAPEKKAGSAAIKSIN
jgi:hypothetical protein